MHNTANRKSIFGDFTLKVPKPSAVPDAWSSKQLFAKALRYVERMEEEDSDSWEHALWSSLALELLARAALANVSPSLLADLRPRGSGELPWHNLYYSLGYVPKGRQHSARSIDANEVFSRLGEIFSEFTKDDQSFCKRHSGRRNAELHSGETPFDGVDGINWHAEFYKACTLLLSSMGLSLMEFVGEEKAGMAEKLISAAADKAAKSVLGDVAASAKQWMALDKNDQVAALTHAKAWASKQYGHRVECPSCRAVSLVFGDPISAPHQVLEDDAITETQEYLPDRFECVACGLKILGLAKLTAVKLSSRYKKTVIYDAAEYYAPEDEFRGFDDDNNEPFQ